MDNDELRQSIIRLEAHAESLGAKIDCLMRNQEENTTRLTRMERAVIGDKELNIPGLAQSSEDHANRIVKIESRFLIGFGIWLALSGALTLYASLKK